MSLNQIPLTTLDGKDTTLGELSDGATLVVNVASKCGLTPQYSALEKLAQDYAARGLTVVADVHVHPDGSGQSDSDRAHPMISRAGHIALILPRFAVAPQPRRDVGLYRYEGAKRWTTVPPGDRRAFLHIGF